MKKKMTDLFIISSPSLNSYSTTPMSSWKSGCTEVLKIYPGKVQYAFTRKMADHF